jgi:hypothetical protein
MASATCKRGGVLGSCPGLWPLIDRDEHAIAVVQRDRGDRQFPTGLRAQALDLSKTRRDGLPADAFERPTQEA